MTTLVQALQFTVEELQAKTLEELQELHSVLCSSKQKKARLQADLVAGIVSAKKKEQKAETQAEAGEKVENSVKVKPKKKATVKKKADAQAQAPEETPEETPEDEKDEKTGEKADAPKATSKKATPKKAEAKPLEEMTKEELLAYVKQLQSRDIFPEVIEGEKVRFTRVKLETVQDIQRVLLEKPYQLYVFADERLDELTQFLVLFANDEIVVLLDRNQQRNTTVTIKTEQLKADHIVFEKEGKFSYRFYLREAKKQEGSA